MSICETVGVSKFTEKINGGQSVNRDRLRNRNRDFSERAKQRSEENFATLARDENVRSVVKPNLDCFLIKVKVCLDSSYTKRDVLSTIAKIFDPVGLMAPVISKAKAFPPAFVEKQNWNGMTFCQLKNIENGNNS
ncbi:hypothetical protein TNCV_1651001 [Trichonephila clavipes]|nr:hypothetical protein TNCV_1651001 [Trichonephila clavipes]